MLNPSIHRNVLEIGPGHGEVTHFLLERGFSVTCIESDHENVSFLEKMFSEHIAQGMLRVEKGNILELEKGTYDAIIGNIPYHITSSIIFHLSHLRFRMAILMVQKEVALRIAATPGTEEYSRLSVNCQIRYKCSLERMVGRGNFRPVPKVDSAILRLVPISSHESDIEGVDNVIKRAFSMRRKKLSTIFKDCPEEYKEKRPQDLSPEDYIKLYKSLLGGVSR